MKFFIYFLSFYFFTAAGLFAKEVKLEDKAKTPNIANFKKDNREDLQPIDFKKLFSDAENYFNKAKAWQKLKCQPKTGFICSKHECKKREITTILILDKANSIIKRCEKDDLCERFKAKFEQTGVYYNVQTQGPVGTLIRVLGDSRYKEISTIGLDAYIVNGNCEIIGNDEYKEEGDDEVNE